MNDPDTARASAAYAARARRHHVVVSVLLGVLFVLASLLSALLPALAVVYLVVGFEVREVVVILVLWAASATLTVATFLAISRTFARAVLRHRVVDPLVPTVPSED